VGGIITCNGECEDTRLGQDFKNHLQISNNQDANELRDHVIIQSHLGFFVRTQCCSIMAIVCRKERSEDV
jgi:hypothetical protein